MLLQVDVEVEQIRRMYGRDDDHLSICKQLTL